VAALDLLHTLSFSGLSLFQNDSNLPTQLWIAARYMESLSFIAAFFFLKRKKMLRGDSVFLLFLVISLAITLFVFYWRVFPDAFIEGSGLTEFKISSEYLISFFFLVSFGLLYSNRRLFDPRFAQFLMLSLSVKIASEVFFSHYASVTDLSMLMGHLLKVLSFFLLYKAIIEIALIDPYNVLFRDLKQSEQKYRDLVDNSLVGIYRADLEGNYLYVNEAMAEMFEFETPEAMIREGGKMRYEKESDRMIFHDRLQKEGRIANYELAGKTKTGKKINILSNAMIAGNERSGMILNITLRKKLENLLQKNIREQQIIIDSVSAMIFFKDRENRLIRVNKAFEKTMGVPKKRLEGLSLSEIYPAYQAEAFQKSDLEVIKSGKEKLGIIEYMDTSVGTRLVQTDKVPYFDESGEIAGIIGFSIDITENKKAEEALRESEAKYRQLFSSMASGVAYHEIKYDRKGNPVDYVFIEANESYEKMTGLKREELIGKSALDIIPKMKEYPFDWIGAYGKVGCGGEPLRFDRYSNFLKRWISISVYSPKKNFVISVFEDVHERRKAEDAKDEFLSLASHQLKTPLSSIGLSSELLLRGVSGKLENEQREYLEDINKSVKRMTLLVNNLLDVSRLDIGSFEFKRSPLNLPLAIDSVLGEFEPLIQEKNIYLTKNYEKNIPTIFFGGKSFRTVFDNLLSNAIRYTPRKGKISVELKMDNGNILLSVSDTGCGIPEGQKINIFKKSFRSDNAIRISRDGADLGLYIAKTITKKTNSKIWFTSQEGKGTTFYLSIPIKRS
jgi:PAS domain S-box-containing protein